MATELGQQASEKNALNRTSCNEAAATNKWALPGFILSWVVFFAILTLIPTSETLKPKGGLL
ncbi:hypothetical protein N752_01235 [Desulforamulus aquiferis]|nr:hypothetical protein [Desulforamulus aquiferis]RYD06942.1 hypothetical protein N752_01235 [Desulforamulus aquiferis]